MAIEIDDRNVVLRGDCTMIALDAPVGGRARLLHAGPDLAGSTLRDLVKLAARQHAPGGPETPIEPSLLNTIGTGHPSPPGLLMHRAGKDWAPDPRVESVRKIGDLSLQIVCSDPHCDIELVHSFHIEEASDVAHISSTLRNTGDSDLTVEWLASICLPVHRRLIRLTSFTGKWAGEFQMETGNLRQGSYLRENRAGRTSHESYPGFYLESESTGEEIGPALAIHLGHSGNHRMRVDQLSDGEIVVQAGELLLPGEVVLGSGEHYSAPPIMTCWSDHGRGDVTRRLHRFVRDSLVKGSPARRVHFNTWEAVYFDHSEEKLFALAEQAAEIGAERFVLDDGWFGGRRNERAGLGDWHVSADVYPNGLEPLADHVRSLGMEFGLWFEPEMVSPDSDLYRAHPDWVLSVEGAEPIPSRHQLPLDLTRDEVSDHLFERMDALVRELGIAYIKWDMNRDIQHPGDRDGRAVASAQNRAVSALINRLRGAHPELAIESCASGGGRADYNMVERTGRIWTSDNNDARARHGIMRGAAYFLPLEVLGNHVGPAKCHITGRRFDMAFRAGTAIFGHMGMELDLAGESAADRALLAEAIALHKRHRALIHKGDYYRLELPAHINGIGVVREDRSEALFQIAVLEQHPSPHPPRARFAGLDRDRRYRMTCVWPPDRQGELASYSGSALCEYGLQLPQCWPDTCLIYRLEAEQAGGGAAR